MKDLKISQMPKGIQMDLDALIPALLLGKNVSLTIDHLYKLLHLMPVAEVVGEPVDNDVLELKRRGHYRFQKIQLLKVTTEKGLPYSLRFIAMPNCSIWINGIEYKGESKEKAFEADAVYIAYIQENGDASFVKEKDDNKIITFE